MNIKRKFTISNIVMLATPIILIGIVTAIFIAAFIITFPADKFYISKIELLDIHNLTKYLGEFFGKNPNAIKYISIWGLICIFIIVSAITSISIILSKSILKPINELTKAAVNIKSGNLDFEVLRASDEEIDKLCVVFNEMRQELKTSKERELFLKQERNMLLANLSHDLKTPVTSIKGYVKGIQDGVANTPEKMDKYLSTISSKATIIEDMVNNLSLFSKLELSKLQFDFEIGDINSFIKEIYEEVKFDLDKNNVELKIELPQEEYNVKLDCEKLYRVFTNLIDNAVKYKCEGRGYIKISTQLEHNGVVITISDKGLGMAESELKKVFDSFYRIDPSRNSDIKGSGLGLGISKQIIEQHGGKLWFQSKLQEGTTALIYLPLRQNPNNI